jgi:H+-transporting ATPase
MSILKHRNGRSKTDDLESGPSTPTSPTHKDEAPYEGEEYDVLLRYARDQAALAGKGDDDDDDDDEDDGQRKRLWYAPWKTVTVKSEKEKKVCILFFVPAWNSSVVIPRYRTIGSKLT